MIGNSLAAQIVLTTGILLLTAIAPLAFIHHILHLLFHQSPLLPAHAFDSPFSWHSILHYWLGIELLFYVYFVTAYRRLQRGSRYVPLADHERSALFYRCFTECGKIEDFFPGWFKRADHLPRNIRYTAITIEEVYRENAREWLAWGFFGESLDEAQANTHTWDQLNWMLDYIEETSGLKFIEGYNPDIKALRLNLDPVKAVHRPWLFYFIVFILDSLCKLLLRLVGFRRYGREPRNFTGFATSLAGSYYDGEADIDMENDHHHHQHTANSRSTSTSDHQQHTFRRRGPLVTYWYRPGRNEVADTMSTTTTATTTTKHDQQQRDTNRGSNGLASSNILPIVITHGIGIGMSSYLKFIWCVFQATRGNAPIYLVELPHVSMRFHGRAPTVPETVRELDAALVERGHSKAVFVGHSLGSTIVAGMCRHARKRVAAAVLVDPICFLLHLPTVAYGFVHRRPARANERFIAFFASRELFISRFISRSFHWYHSCMWADDLPSNATVFLSRDDLLVPSLEVSKYLERHRVQQHMMPLDHAQFMINSHWESQIVKQIADYAIGHTNDSNSQNVTELPTITTTASVIS